MVDKPCGCKEPCGHYAWLEDPDYMSEDLTISDDKSEELTTETDMRKVKDDSIKHTLFMEGKCIRCRVKIEEIPEEVYTVKGLLEYPLHNFHACNGTLYHVVCPKKEPKLLD